MDAISFRDHLETGWTDRKHRGEQFICWMLKIGSRPTELHVIQNYPKMTDFVSRVNRFDTNLFLATSVCIVFPSLFSCTLYLCSTRSVMPVSSYDCGNAIEVLDLSVGRVHATRARLARFLFQTQVVCV
jgi:hypothetical protein